MTRVCAVHKRNDKPASCKVCAAYARVKAAK